jgi:uncharacterized phage protein (TIGR02218 family)
MKTLTPQLAGHIDETVTSLATCWRLERRDGVILGFTTHDRPLTIDGLPYRAASGFTPTAIASSNALNVDDLEVEGVLSSAAISDADLRAGRFDFARIDIFLVNWAAPDGGKLSLRTGWLGEVTLRDGRFSAEVRGLMQPLQQPVGAVFSPECRADLGDLDCRVALAAFSVTGAVSATTGADTFTDSARTEPDGWFDYGLLTWLSGPNAGLEMEIKNQTGTLFTLFQAMPSAIQTGDAYSLVAGCDRRFATCKTKFANAVNFRGEPFVPGRDALFAYPGLK